MTENERRVWLTVSGKRHQAISQAACRGGYRCDRCEAPSASIGHTGTGTAVRVLCGSCYKADLNAERATRPSRAELVARVNAAITR